MMVGKRSLPKAVTSGEGSRLFDIVRHILGIQIDRRGHAGQNSRASGDNNAKPTQEFCKSAMMD